MDKKALMEKARYAAKFSYSPYSNVKVGAAVLCKNQKIYTGTNIENASFGATVCAERVALFKAVSEGEKDFLEIAVTHIPCGICRQVLSEFAPNLIVHVKNGDDIITYKLSDLLPNAFSNKNF
ncbi:MAG: cytidine deaminase [Clostridiaceae bacterium]|nr:cytidine deaminase [Clostridiaceae bacterium]